MRDRTSLETAETARGHVVCQDKRWGLNTAVWFKNHSEKSFGQGEHLFENKSHSSLYYSKCFRFIKSPPFPSTHPTSDMSSGFLTVISVSRKYTKNRHPVASVEEMFKRGRAKETFSQRQNRYYRLDVKNKDGTSRTLTQANHYPNRKAREEKKKKKSANIRLSHSSGSPDSQQSSPQYEWQGPQSQRADSTW